MLRLLITLDPSDPDRTERALYTIEVANKGLTGRDADEHLYAVHCIKHPEHDGATGYAFPSREVTHDRSEGALVLVRKALEAVGR